jgi:hypothetical protein
LKSSIAEQVERERMRHSKQAEAKRQRDAYLSSCGDAPVLSANNAELSGLAAALARTHSADSVEVSQCTKPVLSEKKCWISVCSIKRKYALGEVRQRVAYACSKWGFEALK